MSVSDSNFNPRNTNSITACLVGPADRTGMVKIFVFLDLNKKSCFSLGHYLMSGRIVRKNLFISLRLSKRNG
jgi:hypothetical protein